MDGLDVQDNSSQLGSASNSAGPCGGFGAESLFAAQRLASGTHSMLLAVNAQEEHEFQFFGGLITLEVTTNGRDVIDGTVMDDRPRRSVDACTEWSCVGWSYMGYYSRLDVLFQALRLRGPTNTVSYTFTGASGMILHGTVWFDSHVLSLSLDGTNYNLDATTSWLDGSIVFLAKGNLDPAATHTLTVTNYNPDKPCLPNGMFCCVGFDSLVLLKPGSDLVTSSTTTSTPATNIAPPRPALSPAGKSIVRPTVGGLLGALFLVASAVARRRQEITAIPPAATSIHTARLWQADNRMRLTACGTGSAAQASLLSQAPFSYRTTQETSTRVRSSNTVDGPVDWSRAYAERSSNAGMRSSAFSSDYSDLRERFVSLHPHALDQQLSAFYDEAPQQCPG